MSSKKSFLFLVGGGVFLFIFLIFLIAPSSKKEPGGDSFKSFSSTEIAVSQCAQGENLCGSKKTECVNDLCPQYTSAILAATGKTGLPTALLKSLMVNESACSMLHEEEDGPRCGLMGLDPEEAKKYADGCGVSPDLLSCNFLQNPKNASASICMGALRLKDLSEGLSGCPGGMRHAIAAYKSGTEACLPAGACGSEKNCEGDFARKWECLWSDTSRARCDTKHSGTRNYVLNVQYCYLNPGF